MAAYSDLLLPQYDAVGAYNFPLFEDFAKDFLRYEFQGNGIDGILGSEFHADMEKNISLLGVCELDNLNSLSTILEDEKDGKVDLGCLISNMDCRVESSFVGHRNVAWARELRDGVDMASEITGTICPPSAEQKDLTSVRTMIAANELNRMSLEDIGGEDHIRSDAAVPLLQSKFSSSNHNRLSSSSDSSPRSSAKGTCPMWNTINSFARNGMANGMLIHDTNSNIPQRNSPLIQSANCSARPNLAQHIDAACVNNFPPQVLQSTDLPSVQRSQSSHALGQLGSLASQVPLRVQSLSFLQPLLGSEALSLSRPDLSDLQGMTTRPSTASMRRVYSTGDLQAFHGAETFHGGSSPVLMEYSSLEETGLKIGHHTSEERKMKLNRYRQKRLERNFDKKIKYACRKTLADSRPRIRGRFARTDDAGESMINKTHEDQDHEEVTFS